MQMQIRKFINPGNPKFIVWLFLVMFFMILIFALQSCNPVKVAARKDAQAVDRVKGSRNLINQIAPIVNDLFPCNSDTIIKIKSDTLTHYDTTQTFYHYTDSINKVDTVVVKITKTSVIRDTLKIVTDSKQRAMIDGQTIANLNTALSASTQAVTDAEGATRKADSWLWWFIGAAVLLVGSNGIWIYSKFKV